MLTLFVHVHRNPSWLLFGGAALCAWSAGCRARTDDVREASSGGSGVTATGGSNQAAGTASGAQGGSDAGQGGSNAGAQTGGAVSGGASGGGERGGASGSGGGGASAGADACGNSCERGTLCVCPCGPGPREFACTCLKSCTDEADCDGGMCRQMTGGSRVCPPYYAFCMVGAQ